MKSFRLHVPRGPGLVGDVVGIVLGFVVAWVVIRSGWFGENGRVWFLLIGALSLGSLRGIYKGKLRKKYPAARWLPVLTIGQSFLIVGVAALLMLPGVGNPGIALIFLLPAIVCIATFVYVNRGDPDVME